MPPTLLSPRAQSIAARAATVALFVGLCIQCTRWALFFFSPGTPMAPAESLQSGAGGPALAAARPLFGVEADTAAAPQVLANLRVMGVIADHRRAAALVSVDGKPARPFAVDEEVVPGVRIRQILPGAVIAERAGQRVELPAPERPSLSVLTAGSSATSSPTSSASPSPPASSLSVPSVPPSPAGPNHPLGLVPPPPPTPGMPGAPLAAPALMPSPTPATGVPVTAPPAPPAGG